MSEDLNSRIRCLLTFYWMFWACLKVTPLPCYTTSTILMLLLFGYSLGGYKACQLLNWRTVSLQVCQQHVPKQPNVFIYRCPHMTEFPWLPWEVTECLEIGGRETESAMRENEDSMSCYFMKDSGFCPGSLGRSVVTHASLVFFLVEEPEGSLIRMMFPSFQRAPEGSSLSFLFARACWNAACAWSGAEQSSFLARWIWQQK